MNSYYCYIIKITKNNKLRGFKIGERGDTDRVENLTFFVRNPLTSVNG